MYTPIKRYHRTDGWRGYPIPANAVAGSSDTGRWEDSPCPTPEVLAELRRFRKEVLKPLGIKAHSRTGVTANVFCGKRWVCVPPESFDRAAKAALAWFEKHDRDVRYVHDADLEKCIAPEAA